MRLLTICSLLGCSALLAIGSCNLQPERKQARIFSPQRLQPFLVTIDIAKDTLIRTPDGIQLHIPSHAIDANGASHARLSIRAALTLEDMIRGGLQTISHGKPLSSLGMIEIIPAEGQQLSIRQAIHVDIPGPYRDSNTRLFKGSIDANGNLGWTDPQTLPKDAKDTQLLYGAGLFENSCRSCHAVDKVITGPPLAYIGRRRDRLWLSNFIRNNQRLLQQGDPYAHCIFQQYNKTPMNLFPNLTDADIDALLAFLDNEGARMRLPLPDDAWKKCIDTCLRIMPDSVYHPKYDVGKDAGIPTWIAAQYQRPVPPASFTGTSFSVSTFGWYNLDLFVHQCEDVLTCGIRIRLMGKYNRTNNIYILIPSAKVFCNLNDWLTQTAYKDGVYTASGELSLPRNSPAAIWVMDEMDEKKVFASIKFNIRGSQSFDLTPEPIGQDFIDEQIKMLKLDAPKPQASPQPAAAAVKPARQRACDCGCGYDPY